jgi:hypothetical protein
MRSLAAFVLLLVGALMVPVATAGWWLRDTIVPEASYVATVAPLASDGRVQDAVSHLLVRRTLDAMDGLDPAVAGKLEPLLRRAVDVVVASPAFEQAWRDANRAAHEEIVGALEGGSDAVHAEDGAVVELRLGPLAAAVRKEVNSSGLPLGVAIPRTDASYPIGDTADLARARTAYGLLHDYGRALPVVAGVLLLLGLALARERAPALALAALGALLGLGGLWLLVGLGRTRYLDGLPAGVPEPAGRAYYDTVTAGLVHSIYLVAIAAAVACAVGIVGSLAGRRR